MTAIHLRDPWVKMLQTRLLKKILNKIRPAKRESSANPHENPNWPRVAIAANVILGTYPDLIAFAESSLTEKELEFFNEVLLVMLSRLNFSDPEKQRKLFEKAEYYGMHILPVHFYSPIPSRNEIASVPIQRKFDHVPNLAISRLELSELMKQLVPYFSELSDLPVNSTPESGDEFYWTNSTFGPIDVCLYYSLIRFLKPDRVVEIGGGFSTLIALKALKKNQTGKLQCIEPFPAPMLKKLHQEGSIDLIIDKVQSTSLEVFSSLKTNDILFVDSSHVSKFGSDVNFEVFYILPNLQKGVWAHFHDIFYPSDYPRRWVEDLRLFWNEQYLVLAFLAFNSNFRIRMPNHFLAQEMKDHIEPHLPYINQSQIKSEVGGSLWIERI